MLPAHLPITVITPGPGVSWTHARAAAAPDICCSGCHTATDTPLSIASLHHEVATSVRAEHLSASRVVSGGGEGAQTAGLLPSGLPFGRDGDGGAGGGGEVKFMGHCHGGVMVPYIANTILPS